MTARVVRRISVKRVHATVEASYAGRVKGSRRGLVLDLAFCSALMAFGVGVTTRSDEAGGATSLDTVLLPTVILPVLLRRRSPFGAAAALAAGCVVSGIPTFDQFRLGIAIPAAMVILFPLARRAGRGQALGGLGLVLGGMVFIGLTDVVLTKEGGVIGMVLFSFPLCIGSWVGGRFVRSRDELSDQLAERSRQLERRREQTAALAVEVERTRLASELDATARARVREIVDLAERGERSAATNPDGARESFPRIERMGRDSLNDMRGLLGVLRSDERGRRAPRPTLAQLETLLADARHGGRLVELEVKGERRPLPSGVELAAYRAVQHALVAVRGVNGEPATIELRYLPGALEIEVCGMPVSGSGGGVALVAAKERVKVHGGSFETDSSTGRCVVRARLPVAAAHA
jgi:signal transduction histidine kinase